jgi:GNAT superfamily N-acetyltransferase
VAEWRVRTARAGDAAALAGLRREADEQHAALAPDFFRAPPAPLPEVTLDDHAHLLVAEDAGGCVCGFSVVEIFYTPPSPTMVPARRAHLESLIVARAHRRAGCGRALLRASADWARVRGARQLLLTVWRGNRDAEAFYAALGYHPISQVLGTEL